MAERRIGWRDVADLLPGTMRLLQAERELRRRPIGELLAIASAVRGGVRSAAERHGEEDGVPAPWPSASARAQAERIGRAVARAAKYGPVRSKCLARSLAMLAWLRAAGIDGAELRIGVRRVRGEVQAHAWVICGDTVLGDAEQHVRTFAPIAAAAAAGLRW